MHHGPQEQVAWQSWTVALALYFFLHDEGPRELAVGWPGQGAIGWWEG